MKVFLLFTAGICLLPFLYRADKPQADVAVVEARIVDPATAAGSLTAEPPNEVKLIFQRYGYAGTTAAKMKPEELQTLNAYLVSITGNGCVTKSIKGCHTCAGPCPTEVQSENEYPQRFGYTWETSCGITTVVYCTPAPGVEGC